MLHYPQIDPIALQIGPIAVRWYGLMYLAGFLAFWWLGRRRAKSTDTGWKASEIDDLLFYGALGVILGGRLGYVLFYDLASTLGNPASVFKIWEGGMSFHGGLLGVLVAMAWYARSTRRRFFEVTDFVAPMIPIGLAFGRLGNFINNELWGKPTDLPWGMLVPGHGESPLHPSQLYQAGLEGVALFIMLWIYSAKPRPVMAVSGVFLIGYGCFRFLVEFVRVPDADIGYLAFDWLTMGQILSTPMVLVGVVLVWLAYNQSVYASAPVANSQSQDAPTSGKRKRKRKRR